MPEGGIKYVDRTDLLSYEEMFRLVSICGDLGIHKVRITGGEPFLRKGLMRFLEQISKLKTIKSWHITTNGTIHPEYIPELKNLGIGSVNLSLDTLDKERFYKITRRDEVHKVQSTLDQLLNLEIPTKINMVAMRGINDMDIVPMIKLARTSLVNVRFLEEMPFNGIKNEVGQEIMNYRDILEIIKSHYPDIERLPSEPSSTSVNYKIPGHKGTIGIIASYSRTFCGTCDRIRITPIGQLKTCLYDDGVMNLRDLLRAGASDDEVSSALRSAMGHRAKDGWEAEAKRTKSFIDESMATIGG